MATSRENKTISQFKTALIGGGARPNLFEVELTTLPDQVEGWDADNFRFLCKAAALPASNIASIDVPFRGRIFKVAGDRTFDTWTVTVINDEDFRLRNAFEAWMETISKLDNNLGATNPESYMKMLRYSSWVEVQLQAAEITLDHPMLSSKSMNSLTFSQLTFQKSHFLTIPLIQLKSTL